jgi:hypothetical protein
MKSARRLQKKAYIRAPSYDEFSVELYGNIWEIWPINYFLFAIDSIDLKSIASAMEKIYSEEKLPVHSRIDCTDKGVICNYYPNGH